MPYTDATGTLMIDEVAASKDIATMKAAKEKLSQAWEKMQQIISMNSDYAGPVKDSVEYTSSSFSSSIRTQMDLIEDTIRYIDHLIEHYKMIDQSVKGTINTAL
ncbi:MAG: hypothetical protein K6E26_10580 [Clostridiales bacterium]|nr:hypothetical protein [Clostridiales bacterium]